MKKSHNVCQCFFVMFHSILHIFSPSLMQGSSPGLRVPAAVSPVKKITRYNSLGGPHKPCSGAWTYGGSISIDID